MYSLYKQGLVLSRIRWVTYKYMVSSSLDVWRLYCYLHQIGPSVDKQKKIDCLQSTRSFCNELQYYHRHRWAMWHTIIMLFYWEIQFISPIPPHINYIREHATYKNENIDCYNCMIDLLLSLLMRSVNTNTSNICALNIMHSMGSSTNFW